MARTVSLDLQLALEKVAKDQRQIIQKELAIRELIREALGMSYEEWYAFLDTVIKDDRDEIDRLDPVRKYKDVVKLMTAIIDNSSDVYACTVAQETINLLVPGFLASVTGEEELYAPARTAATNVVGESTAGA